MSPQSRRRGQAGSGAPPNALFDELLLAARELLAVRSPLDAELMVSDLLGTWWPQRHHTIGGTGVEQLVGEGLVDYAARQRSSAALALPLYGLGDNAASRRAVRELRGVLVPDTLGRIPGARIAVTGDTAQDIDFTNQMRRGVPYVVAFVLALAFVLLLVAFRSIVIPIKAIVLNLISVGESYGVLVDRKLAQAVYKKTLPGHPDGDYVTAVFTSRFDKKADVRETVTVMLEPDGHWRVTGYSPG